LSEDPPEVQEVISAKTARTMMVFLKEVTRSGTAAVASSLNHPLGGKTGTTSDFTDAWFLGFSPSVTCGVWMGYDNRQSLGDKETGAKAALPIWMDFMKAAIAGRTDESFPADMQHNGSVDQRVRQIAAAVRPEPKPPLHAGPSGQPAQP